MSNDEANAVSPPSAALPRQERIASRRDFLRAYEEGRKVFSRYVVLFCLPNALGHPRLGITATRKVGKAHLRNKLRRWTREVYRVHRDAAGLVGKSVDLVVNVKAAAATVSFAEYAADFSTALRRSVAVTRGGS